MSERINYDALPSGLPREVRSKLLEYESRVIARDERYAVSPSSEGYLDGEISIPDFEYTKLPLNQQCIRLFRLYPGVLDNPQVDGEIFEAEFKHESMGRPDDRLKLVRLSSVEAGIKPGIGEQKHIQYEALSWRWGDEKYGKFAIMIHKNGVLYRKRVSETLGLALKCLRYEKDRYLWIDAICINQEDSDERSSQVSMMSLVYTSALQACVWLGEDDDMSTMAFRFIREEIRGLKNFDQLCTDEVHAPKWRALLVLMQRPWFSRRWVVQEIVLARGATVYCGPEKIPWRELAIAVELFVEVETATHRLSELMRKDEKFRVIPSLFEHISELGASILVNATGKVFRESKHADNAAIEASQGIEILPQRSLLSLEYLVTSLSIFDCGRPHDSVYSLVAVARDARPVAPSATNERTNKSLVMDVCSDFLQEKPYVLNYNRPYADVCKDFVHFCILRCATHDKIQALNILCRPWAKDWRPGEGKFDGHESKLHSSQTEVARKRLIEHESTWIKRFKDGSPDVIDHRGMGEYWREAEQAYPVESIIRKWFPPKAVLAEKHQELATRNLPKIKPRTRNRQRVQNTKINPSTPTIDFAKENALALPSWVTRITAAPFDIFPHPGMDMVKMGRKNADPLAGVPQDRYRNYSAGQTKKVDLKTLMFRRRPRHNHYSLYVRGFWFDTVEEVAQVSQGGAIPGAWLDLAGWSTARRPARPDADIGDPPDAFWRTLVADRGAHDRNPPYYFARACKETIIKGGLRSGAVDTSALIYNERNSIVAEFCRRVQAVIWNRALIKTSEGFLGLASDKVREGDKVCIIYGCTVPVILRKGAWKTQEQYDMEKFEDKVEAMRSLMRRCEMNRARKANWNKKKAEMNPEDLNELRKHREDFNARINARKQDEQSSECDEEYIHSCYDNESDDDTDLESDKSKHQKFDHVNPGGDGKNKVPNGSTTATHKNQSKDNNPTNVLGQQDASVNEMTGSRSNGSKAEEDGKHGDTNQETTTAGASEQSSSSPEHLRDEDDDIVKTEDGKANNYTSTKPPYHRSNTTSRKRLKQQNANNRDLYRHYEFLGEAYVHGMMDGEAVRQNFYKGKPDHVFEIR